MSYKQSAKANIIKSLLMVAAAFVLTIGSVAASVPDAPEVVPDAPDSVPDAPEAVPTVSESLLRMIR